MNVARKSAKPDWWLKRTAKADGCVDRRIAVSSHVTNALLSGIMVLLGYLSLSANNASQEWLQESSAEEAITQAAWQQGESLSANREFCLRAAQIAAERARGRNAEVAGSILIDLDRLLGQPCANSNVNPTAIAYALMTQDSPARQTSLERVAAPILTRSDTHRDGEAQYLITDRFALGEPQMRGFDIRGVGPRVIRADYPSDALGGQAYYLGHAELEIPLGSGAQELGLRPSIFIDANVVCTTDNENLPEGCTTPYFK